MNGRQLGAESFQADRHDAGNTRFSQIYVQMHLIPERILM